MKKYFLILFAISICSSVYAQQLSLVPNQPNYNYYEANKVDEASYILDYPSNNHSGFYTFNGTDIELIPFSDNLPDKRFMVSKDDKSYFVNGNLDTLYEYDGSEVNEIPLPESYFAIVYLATINNKIFFATQVLPHAPKMISFDGITLETYDIPETLLGGENFFYSNSQNLLYFRLISGPSLASLWSFDGQQFTYFDGPPLMTLASFEHELNNEMVFSYYDLSTPDDYYFTLFSCDGNTLSEIESPRNTFFYDVIGKKANKMYARFEDYDTGHRLLYEYDGNNLSSVSTSTENEGYIYIGEFDGKDFLSFFRLDGSMISDLYSYDGNDLVLINGPQNFRPATFAGIRNNNLYILYMDFDNVNYTLYEYSSNATEVTLVPNIPQGFDYFRYFTSNHNKLYYLFGVRWGEYSLFTMDDSGIWEMEVPDYNFLSYEFTQNDKLYFNWYSTNLNDYKLFFLDNSLSISENGEGLNSVSVFPNPVRDNLNIRLNSTEKIEEIEIYLFSLEGKLVDTTILKQTEAGEGYVYPIDNLSKGIYILEIKNRLRTIRKKIIKQ